MIILEYFEVTFAQCIVYIEAFIDNYLVHGSYKCFVIKINQHLNVCSTYKVSFDICNL